MKKITKDVNNIAWEVEKGSTLESLYKDLEMQIEEVFKHCKKHSRLTLNRYKYGIKDVAKFLVINYQTQSLNHINNKELEEYVQQTLKLGYSRSYIATNLSAARFFIEQINDSSYIMSNPELGLEV